ncbi:hypothetical protein BC751_3451 [Cecembia calidifontis]|jgi:hypothetical protein|uniref:Uncharacterized protein n=1 Tax=Cecembia calidifontis TaxID=1187080 RepID=A0A4Q7PC08_9BACT|nr:hypothetical protein BC751_3451 [Cecembia calidifontis]
MPFLNDLIFSIFAIDFRRLIIIYLYIVKNFFGCYPSFQKLRNRNSLDQEIPGTVSIMGIEYALIKERQHYESILRNICHENIYEFKLMKNY